MLTYNMITYDNLLTEFNNGLSLELPIKKVVIKPSLGESATNGMRSLWQRSQHFMPPVPFSPLRGGATGRALDLAINRSWVQILLEAKAA